MFPNSIILTNYRYSLSNLRDPDPNVRYTEAKARFCKTRDRPEVIQALIDALAVETDTRVRVRIASTLGSSSSEQAIAPLAQMLKSDDPQDRIGAPYGLSITGKPAAIGMLIQALQDTDAGVRVTAVNLLRFPCIDKLDPNVEKALSGLLETELDESVRKAAQNAIQFIRRPIAPKNTCLTDFT